MLSAWSGMRGIVYISGGVVASHSFVDIESLLQTDMILLVCVFCKEIKFYEMI